MGKIFRRGIDFSGGGGSISNPTASSVTFDNTDTGLEATNVQDAVTEVNGKLTNLFTWSEYIALSDNPIISYRYNGISVEIHFNTNTYTNDNETLVGKLPTNLAPKNLIYLVGENNMLVRIEETGNIKLIAPTMYSRGFVTYSYK